MSLVEGTEWFQFTHPGGVRLVSEFVLPNTYHVSIHAPGRGATGLTPLLRMVVRVSIHAPGRGATSTISVKDKTLGTFQFTHPGGVRPPEEIAKILDLFVSIHAPGRGAT